MTTPLSSPSRGLFGIVFCCASFGLPAQNETPAPPDPDAILMNAVLVQSLERMVRLDRLAFRSTEAQDQAVNRAIARIVGGPIGDDRNLVVHGSSVKGLRRATLPGGEEVVFYRGRAIFRTEAEGWRLRGAARVARRPFVLDPGLFFDVLLTLERKELKVERHTTTTRENTELVTLGLTLEGRAARDFALSGALPPMSGAGVGLPQEMRKLPDLTVDLALDVELATRHVHGIRSRCYRKSASAPKIAVRGGFDQSNRVADEIQERGRDGQRIYKDGLPVRALKDNVSVMEFDVVLSGHGRAPRGRLDGRARRLLRVGR